MVRTLALVPLLLAACKSSGGSGGPPPPSSGSEAGSGVVQPSEAGGDTASAPPSSSTPYQDVVVGKSLPSGQLLQVGRPRWSHPGIADQVYLAASGAIISASSSHVRLWDASSGALRWQVFAPSSLSRFALSSDEKLIAIAQGDFDRARVAVYELGGALRFAVETSGVSSLAFSQDGTKVAIASSSVLLYDVAAGKLLKNLRGLAFTVGFSADGRLVTIGKDLVQRWNLADDQAEQIASIPRSARVSAINRSSTAVAWGDGFTLEVAKLGGEKTKIDAAAPAPISSIALSADGDAALIGWPGGIAAWSLGPSPAKRWQIETRGKSRPALAFASSGKVAAAADARGVFTLDALTGKEHTSKEQPLRFVGFAADGNLIVARGNDYHLVDVRTGAKGAKQDMPQGSPSSADSFLYGAGGIAVAWDSGAEGECKPFTAWLSGQGERTIRTPPGPWHVGPGFVVADGSKTTIWDLVENKPRLVLPSTPRPRIGLAFSVDRHWLVTAYGPVDAAGRNPDDGTFLAVFDLSTAKATTPARAVREIQWTAPASLRALSILADGSIIAGSTDGIIHKAAPGATAFEKVAELIAKVVLLDASPDGKTVAATDEDGLTTILEP